MCGIGLKIYQLASTAKRENFAPIKISLQLFYIIFLSGGEIKKMSAKKKNKYLKLLLSFLETCYACKSFKYAIRICNKTPSVQKKYL